MCMTSRIVRVKVPSDLSHTGKAFYRKFFIDSCIAKIVEALQKGKVDMRFSCCGHGDADGEIHLQDGRVLVVTTMDKIKRKQGDLDFYKEHYDILVDELEKLEKQIKKRGNVKGSLVTVRAKTHRTTAAVRKRKAASIPVKDKLS